ncbi:MAG: hypothetical protein KA270_09920 [Saprospiraceae bacterium]|jgi:hypothetical protein|nr:hypothetical protein [Saprospiraceae bacterium]MBP6567474.1 hypothetical protein [Saprospiraceae bacterium]
MSINDDKKDGLISKLPKSVVYASLLGSAFVAGIVAAIFYSNFVNSDHKNLISSLEIGALAQCIPVNLLASDQATTVYLEEICNFASRLGGGIESANVENTIRIHEADADTLRAHFESSTGQTTAVVFSLPELLKVLKDAYNVERISQNAISLENLGLGIVFGTYPQDRPDYVPTGASYSPGSNTCYVEFVNLSPLSSQPNADGNYYYESVMGSAFNYPNETTTASVPEPLLFNFPRLCPTYCPPSTQPQ